VTHARGPESALNRDGNGADASELGNDRRFQMSVVAHQVLHHGDSMRKNQRKSERAPSA